MERFYQNQTNIKLLMLLRDNGRIVRSSIHRKYGLDYNYAKKSAEILESLGLVLYETTGDHNDTVYWSLTEKGKRAAWMLEELDEFIRKE